MQKTSHTTKQVLREFHYSAKNLFFAIHFLFVFLSYRFLNENLSNVTRLT